MKPQLLILSLFACLLTACWSLFNIDDSRVYYGNFEERQLSFTPAIQQPYALDEYVQEMYDEKFGSTLSGSYDWFRNPQHLQVAFNTAKAVGLEKLISKELYKCPPKTSLLGDDWGKKPLEEIVKGFLESDTVADEQQYFREFWARRKKEGNLTITYQIMQEVDAFYHGEALAASSPVNDTLAQLLTFDHALLAADSSTYLPPVFTYFNYLKEIGLYFSAYELIEYDVHQKLPVFVRDSLFDTLQADTISYDEWIETNINFDGWVNFGMYNQQK